MDWIGEYAPITNETEIAIGLWVRKKEPDGSYFYLQVSRYLLLLGYKLNPKGEDLEKTHARLMHINKSQMIHKGYEFKCD